MLYVPLKAVIVGLIDKARKFGIVRKTLTFNFNQNTYAFEFNLIVKSHTIH